MENKLAGGIGKSKVGYARLAGAHAYRFPNRAPSVRNANCNADVNDNCNGDGLNAKAARLHCANRAQGASQASETAKASAILPAFLTSLRQSHKSQRHNNRTRKTRLVRHELAADDIRIEESRRQVATIEDVLDTHETGHAQLCEGAHRSPQ